MLAILSVLFGTILVALTLADLSLTVLHPSRRGPLSWPVSKALFWATHQLATRRRSPALLSFAGPAAMVAHFSIWLGGLWGGFAFIYLPSAHRLLGGSHNLGHLIVSAFYISGLALTTAGFGNLAVPTDLLRLTVVLESVCGLVAIASSISFLLSVYPLTSRMRQASARLWDAGALSADGAAHLARAGGASELARLQDDLVEAHQDLKRFPVLALFRPTQQRESLTTLFEGAFWVCLHLRYSTLDPARSPQARFYGRAL